MVEGSEWVKVGLDVVITIVSAMAWTGATAWGVVRYLLNQVDKSKKEILAEMRQSEGRQKEQHQRIEGASIERDKALTDAHASLLKQIHAQTEDHILGFMRKDEGLEIKRDLGNQIQTVSDAIHRRFDDLKDVMKAKRL